AAPRCSALATLSARYLAMLSSTMPVVGSRTISGPAARAPAASTSQPAAINASEIRNRPRRPLGRPPLDMVITPSALSIAPRRREAVPCSGGHTLEVLEHERAP